MSSQSEAIQKALSGLRNPHGDQKELVGHLSTVAKATKSILNAESDLAAKQAACLAARILYHHSDSQTMKACLAVLMQSGRTGRVAARRQIQSQSISQQEMASVTMRLPPPHRLLLAHEFLRTQGCLDDKSLLGWLETLTSSLQEADSEKLLAGLAILGRGGEELAYPVKRVLMGGNFAPWLRTVLSSPIGMKDIEPVVMALKTLADKEMNKFAYKGLASGGIVADSRLINVLCSQSAPSDQNLAKALQALLKRTELKAALECLEGFLHLGWPRSGDVIALLLSKKPKEINGFASHAALLTEYGLGSLLKKLPAKTRDAFLARMFTALAAMDPDFLAAQLKTEPEETVMYAAQLKAFVTENAVTLLNVDELARPACDIPGEEETKPGIMGRILGDKRQALAKALDKGTDFSGQEFPGSILRKADLKRRQFKQNSLADGIFDSVSFYQIKFRDCDLTGSRFKRARFTECSFKDCRLDRTCFEKNTFMGCEFLYCDFQEAAFSSGHFTNCTFKGVLMQKARLVKTSLEQCSFDQCVLSATHLQGMQIALCHFLGSDFSRTDMLGCTLNGCEFTDCSLNHARLVDSDFPGTDFCGCTANEARIRGIRSDHPLLLLARIRWLHEAAAELAGRLPSPPETALKAEAAPVLRRAAIRWIRHLEFARREARMLRDNRKRHDRALGIMTPEQQKFIRVLPYILHTDIFDQKLGISGTPACSVSGYTPDATTLELARELFPDLEPGNRPTEVEITGLYTMGSYGSMAQTAESDIDSWVCVSSETATHEAMHGLKKKLDALTLWADLQFGLEAHFFPMSEEAVRQNDFGYSDKESSGSAQAILLKEEFYRSALRLAGKNLAWWLVPAGADRKMYARYAQEAIQYPLTEEARIVDLGPLDNVPPGEFFGAAMWQIVKALHSPFKSVMKLGLLERYSGFGTTDGMPLCDTIKGNIFDGVDDIQHIDSYTSLFRELRAHYSDNNDTDAVNLLTESFVAKADFSNVNLFLDHPATEDGRRMVQAVFGEHTAVSGRTLPKKGIWNFSKSLKMGEAVSRFMTGTYKRIQEEISSGGGTASTMITPEDMTRLGRRISANFSTRKHKVSRVPFMDVGKNAFSTLHLSAIKKPGKKTVWLVQGSQKSEGKSSVREMQVLRKDYDPAMLLAWLFFNNLFNPDVLIQADRTIAPLAVADIQKLMASLQEFFPLEETFERDIDEGLQPERVTKAFFLLNLTAPHDMKKVLQVTVIYATTWGEVFCETFDKPDPSIEQQASAFLRKVLKRSLREPLDMQSFIPKGSQCKRIKLV